MTKLVYETAAARQLDALIVLKGKRVIARVLAHHTESACTVNVIHMDGDAEQRSLAKLEKMGKRIKKGEGVQIGRASGYGYDKYTAALSGLVIDGHVLANHCGEQKKFPKGLSYFPRDYKAPRGWAMANSHLRYVLEDGSDVQYFCPEHGDSPEVMERTFWVWGDCYKSSGLDYLRELGYTTVRAI